MTARQSRPQAARRAARPGPLGPVMRLARGAVLFGGLASLAACATGPGGDSVTMPVEEEAAYYRAHARGYYAPPGPASDPWGPYIQEASQRFDVPEEWVRAVIDQESGGKLYHNGQLVTSGPGAMGLMQLMPPTYDDMRTTYNLGGDAYEPHDNIMAGTAYLRQLYDVYGSPGFLAAYNAGPGRLEDFITRNRVLPRETRNYVAAIGRRIVGISPANRSQADLLVASHDTLTQSAQPRAGSEMSAVRTAWANKHASEQPVQVAEAIGSDATQDDTTADNAADTQAGQDTQQAGSATYGRDWHALPRAPRVADGAESPDAVRAAWARRLGTSAQSVANTPVQVAQAADTDAGNTPAADVAATQATSPADGQAVQTAATDAQSDTSWTVNTAENQSNAPAEPVHASSLASGMGFLSTAHAEPVPLLTHRSRVPEVRNWAIQVGAFGSAAMAQQAAGQARHKATALETARPSVAPVQARQGRLYRARLVNLSHSQALDACRKLSGCVVISPDSRS
ncbi:lytic transglycosylase domain-containing protein [Acetobacter sp.]|uniref:lytic transglycosylase domain-containing protein n=1 Tax=Acetobacter sp. TaxID=440 RepID=UPI0039E84264